MVKNGASARLFDCDSEAALLSALMEPATLDALAGDLDPRIFSPPRDAVFLSLCELRSAGAPVSFLTIGKKLDGRTMENLGGASGLSALLSSGAHGLATARHCLGELYDKLRLRELHHVGTSLLADVAAGDPKAATRALEAISKLGDLRVAPLRALMDIATPLNGEDCLLGNRFLCRTGAMLFVGPSGIGKSSASVQQDILWSLGREAFGIRPSGPLRILTIQAENDDGDIVEMRDGVCAGLELSMSDREQIRGRVCYEHECGRTAEDFISFVDARLATGGFDLLRLDPFMAYLGGDVSDPERTAGFLRAGLNPVLKRHRCGCILNHHTPKVTNRDTSQWRGSDWMYAGAGSADVTNWARAALVIDPTHAGDVFRFIAAKRGGRIGWVNEQGEPEISRHYCHSTDGLYWRPATEDDLASVEDSKPGGDGRFKVKHDKSSVLDAMSVIEGITPGAMAKLMRDRHNMSRATLYRFKEALMAEKKFVERDGLWFKAVVSRAS